MGGKGIKDPEPGSKETCDCYSEGEKWEAEDGNRSGLRKSKGKENSEEEESEERKESFEAVQFKSNQTKEKGAEDEPEADRVMAEEFELSQESGDLDYFEEGKKDEEEY